jgi:tripartite-type tricarboxylate transporter receptor subunit TctC
VLLGGGPNLVRVPAAEPGIPAERAAALRKAFSDTMADPEFVADMHKHSLNVEPLSGDEVQGIVAAAVATPGALVEQAKRYAGQ